jgi:hypothetical protein
MSEQPTEKSHPNIGFFLQNDHLLFFLSAEGVGHTAATVEWSVLLPKFVKLLLE